jgi:putative ABC transport system permease protein
MSFLVLIFKSAFRNRLRTGLTAVGVAVAIIAFVFLRTFVGLFYAGADAAASDRMITRNKISIIFELPISYVDRIHQIPGVSEVSWENWFGGYYKDERDFFANFAADDKILDLYPEIMMTPEAKKAYLEDRTGCIVGTRLIEKFGWKIGDRIVLKSPIYKMGTGAESTIELTIRGTYTPGAKNVDDQTLFFHYKYFDEMREERLRNQVGIVVVKVADPAQSTSVVQGIDKTFANSMAETKTESEKQFQLEFISMSSALVAAIEVVSYVVLVILVLILGNTLAMATRERTTEYAVMRAIGFRPAHITWLVRGEGFVVAAVGAALGVALSTPILRALESALTKTPMAAFFAGFQPSIPILVLSAAVALAGGVIASAIPAARAGRLKIVDALRRIE